MTRDEARALTDRIKAAVADVWSMVTEAYEARAWAALGFSSWDDYCTAEFSGCRLRLPREARAEVVQSLRQAGLSVRAIASATGLSVGTVSQSSGVQNRTPDDEPPPPIISRDGKPQLHVDGATWHPACVRRQ